MAAAICKWEMRYPVTVLISRETAALKRSCAGCAHAKTVQTPFGDSVIRCLKGRPYGKRCNQYEVER